MTKDRFEPTWKTADGRVIPISELTDEHLTNILKYLTRKGYTDNIDALKMEAIQRGLDWNKKAPWWYRFLVTIGVINE